MGALRLRVAPPTALQRGCVSTGISAAISLSVPLHNHKSTRNLTHLLRRPHHHHDALIPPKILFNTSARTFLRSKRRDITNLHQTRLYSARMAAQTEWPAKKVRETFLSYFESKQHSIGMCYGLSFSPIMLFSVPSNATLLFSSKEHTQREAGSFSRTAQILNAGDNGPRHRSPCPWITTLRAAFSV